ncbi:MAG: hypothetical protein JWR27_1673 [Aeromicrobium sp.]|jgi:hypothetical protein|nr:hypothetical protein [Aeromicrobium sp.]
MDESSFDIDSGQLAETSRRFPAHRLSPAHATSVGDVSYLAYTPEFGSHAWDEAGHL